MNLDVLFYGGLFGATCVVLLVLPFAPAWLEWRRPTDCAALPIRDDETDEPLFLAERLRARIAGLRAVGPEAGLQPVDGRVLLDRVQPVQDGALPLLATEAIRSAKSLALGQALYVAADLVLGSHTELTEVMSEGRLQLGPRSRICHWAHADADVGLSEGSIAAHRLSSSRSVRLERGCCFQRVHAPVVCFGDRDPGAPAPRRPAAASAELSELPGAEQRSPGLWRVDGDCRIPAGRCYAGSLVVTGLLTVGEGSRIEGSVKGYEGILLGRGASVGGAVVSGRAIHLLGEAAAGGPVVSETHVLLCAGSRVGTPDRPTTVSANEIVAEEGAQAHGTLWARTAGVVTEPRA